MKNNSLYNDVLRTLFSKEEIADAIKVMAQKIVDDYADKKPVMVCILKGASLFFTDLIRQIDLPITIDFMAISSYGSSTETSGNVRILKDLDMDVKDQDVIVVEDIIDSGLTLSYIKEALKSRGVKSIKIATLLDKPSRRKVELSADYFGFEVPNEFVVGYGLDYDEKYRNVPEICVLKPSVYNKQ